MPHYHGSNRGVQNVYLKAEGTNTMFPDDDNLGPNVGYFDVAVKDVSKHGNNKAFNIYWHMKGTFGT